jgi:hypothetical protein
MFNQGFHNADVAVANATSRTNGAVGANAIVPRKVREYLAEFGDKKSTMILDFGSGKHAAHALALVAEGWFVQAHEFGDNYNPSLHYQHALTSKYNVVYASNVLNVQSHLPMMAMTIRQIADVLDEGGVFIANYPQSPRKSSLTPADVVELLEEQFETVTRMKGTTASAPVWLCYK